MSVLQATLITAVLSAVPLLFASLGELITEKVGIFNFGIEGVMLMGAIGGYMSAVKTDSVVLGMLGGAALAAVFTAVVVAGPIVWMRAPQILVGFAAWFMGIGLSSQIGASYVDTPLRVNDEKIAIPLLHSIPFFGKILFQQSWTVYFAVVLTVAVAFMLARTRHGINMRALGEDPASAHAAGVAVRAWQTFYVTLGGALMGLGGAVLSIVVAENFRSGMTSGRGFVAFALVIFAAWRPLRLLWASYFFGVLLILGAVGQLHGWPIAGEFLGMAPYVFTVLVLAARLGWRRSGATGRTAQMPQNLGELFIVGKK